MTDAEFVTGPTGGGGVAGRPPVEDVVRQCEACLGRGYTVVETSESVWERWAYLEKYRDRDWIEVEVAEIRALLDALAEQNRQADAMEDVLADVTEVTTAEVVRLRAKADALREALEDIEATPCHANRCREIARRALAATEEGT